MRNKIDYKALYENERNHNLTLQALIDRHYALFQDLKEHNWKFTDEQKREIETGIFLRSELQTILDTLKIH